MATPPARSPLPAALAAALALLSLPACGDSGDGAGGAGGRAPAARFKVHGQLSGLYGGSVSLVLDDGETLTLEQDGAFAFANEVVDGEGFSLAIAAQPEGFDQTCSVTPASGTVDGADVEASITCVGGPSLVITEIGSCFFSDSACWVELHSRADTPVELSHYTLRTPAALRVAPYTDYDSLELALPEKTIPPHGYVLVRADGHPGLVDGPQVVHVRDGQQVPHWYAGGFVELGFVGRTVDFVRFGDSAEAPSDPTAWAGGDAPALPSSEVDYGRALARDAAELDTDAPADWHVRAFATAGGPNDIDEDADSDDDGLPDQAERAGGTYAGLDLYAMGAREGQRDVLVQIDWMESSDAGITPRKEALLRLVSLFEAHGIALHLDTGPLFSPTFDPASFNLGGGDAVPYASSIVLFDPAPGQLTVWDVKAQHFDIRLSQVAHYALFGSSQSPDGSASGSGYAEILGNDLIVTLGAWGLSLGSQQGKDEVINLQAATLMHELGHNLGLHHGGDSDLNYKPNYYSVMNYSYQVPGLPTIGSPAEGDRQKLAWLWVLGVDCGVDYTTLEGGPLTPSMRIDYSDGSGAAMSEAAIDESKGLGRAGSAPVDFDCDGDATGTGALDVDFDGTTGDTLGDFDDWANLTLAFGRTYQSDNGAAPARRRVDPLTFDRQPVAAELPGPPPAIAARLRAAQ